MSLFELPLDKLLMRKSQWSSVFGLFLECQINYRKMYRLNLSHLFSFSTRRANTEFKALSFKFWIEPCWSFLKEWLTAKQDFLDVILWSHVVKAKDITRKGKKGRSSISMRTWAEHFICSFKFKENRAPCLKVVSRALMIPFSFSKRCTHRTYYVLMCVIPCGKDVIEPTVQ